MFSDDLALTRAAHGGDKAAGLELARRLGIVPKVIVLLGRKFGIELRPGDVDDLSQNTLLSVIEKLGEFAGRAKLETWVYRFCQFEVYNHRRRLARLPKTMSDVGEQDLEEPATVTELPAESTVETLLKHLAPLEARVVRLKHVEGLTLQEIHLRTGIGLSNAKSSYYRGLEKLRRLLGNGELGEAQ